MAKIKGIDVSYYQGKISEAGFNKAVKSGIKFAILRLGYTGSAKYECKEESCFRNNYENAKAAELPVGIYYYSLANSKSEAKREAEFVIKQLKGLDIDYPVYIDVEDSDIRQYKCSKSVLADVCNEWCDTIADAGYTPGVYASLSWFNNKIGNITAEHTKWVAQYNKTCDYKGSYDMWQYSSSENVPGIAKKTDVNWAYKEFDNAEVEKVETRTPYSGEFPKLHVTKTTKKVINDAITWGKMICADNRFHYGYTGPNKKPNAHHNGCYFCGTQKTSGGRSKKGIVDYKYTYCCNPFIHACWAHGGLVPTMLKQCQKGSSYDFHKGKGYDKSALFTNLGKPSKSSLKAGDVLCNDHHVAMYIGDGKLIEASGGDDNKRNSKKWNNSIRITSLTDARYKRFLRVHRFNSKVDFNHTIILGDISTDVKLLQKFLNWYGKYKLTTDGICGDNTVSAIKDFQTKENLTIDGKFGSKCLEAAKKVKI